MIIPLLSLKEQKIPKSQVLGGPRSPYQHSQKLETFLLTISSNNSGILLSCKWHFFIFIDEFGSNNPNTYVLNIHMGARIKFYQANPEKIATIKIYSRRIIMILKIKVSPVPAPLIQTTCAKSQHSVSLKKMGRISNIDFA